jgi:hypothetical protein
MTFRKRPHRKHWKWYFPGILVLAVLAFFNPADGEVIGAPGRNECNCSKAHS